MFTFAIDMTRKIVHGIEENRHNPITGCYSTYVYLLYGVVCFYYASYVYNTYILAGNIIYR